MYQLSKEFRFESSHRLMYHDGKCQRLHGHSWRGKLIFRGEIKDMPLGDPKSNMLIDYGDIGVACKKLEDVLDHQHLNDVLLSHSPTSEFIAKWCYDYIWQNFPDMGQFLTAVEISETCTTACVYKP
jgi:6-pyruvoyltetrahydropterin/6-carboxytetrahydropterin synthase